MTKYVALTDIVSGPFIELSDAETEKQEILEESSLNNLICKGDVCIGDTCSYNSTVNGYYVYDSDDVIHSAYDIDEISELVNNTEQGFADLIILEEISCER